MIPYHFMLLRYVHDASSEEFANVGILMWLPSTRELLFRMHERYARLSAFFKDFDGASYRQMSRAIRQRVRLVQREAEQGTLLVRPAGTIADVVLRIVTEDSTCFSWSKAMGGIADDPQMRIEELLHEFVTSRELAGAPRQRRDEEQILERIDDVLRRHGIAPRLTHGFEVSGRDYSYRFQAAWVNGQRQVMEPISFDYLRAAEVVEKANTWSGRLWNLRGEEFQMTGVVAPPANPELAGAFEQAVTILRSAPNVRAVVRENDFEAFAGEIERDLAGHQ